MIHLTKSEIWSNATKQNMRKRISQTKTRPFYVKLSSEIRGKDVLSTKIGLSNLKNTFHPPKIRNLQQCRKDKCKKKNISHAKNWAFGANIIKRNTKKKTFYRPKTGLFHLKTTFHLPKSVIKEGCRKAKYEKKMFHRLKSGLLELTPPSETEENDVLSAKIHLLQLENMSHQPKSGSSSNAKKQNMIKRSFTK